MVWHSGLGRPEPKALGVERRDQIAQTTEILALIRSTEEGLACGDRGAGLWIGAQTNHSDRLTDDVDDAARVSTTIDNVDFMRHYIQEEAY
jgi:hypothetical protein